MVNISKDSTDKRKNTAPILMVILVALLVLTIIISLPFLAIGLFAISIDGFSNSIQAPCQSYAKKMISDKQSELNDFAKITYIENVISVDTVGPQVATGDCVDSTPSLTIAKEYVVSESPVQVNNDVGNALAAQGYKPQYGDLQCDSGIYEYGKGELATDAYTSVDVTLECNVQKDTVTKVTIARTVYSDNDDLGR